MSTRWAEEILGHNMSAQYIVGIDLGTTNSVLAWTPLLCDEPQIEVMPLPQLVAAGTLEERGQLPSFLYLGTQAEQTAGVLDLSWATGRDYVVGEWARRLSAEQPLRTVGAAKSWLCHSRVDRHQPILPWGSQEDVRKISPVTASCRYLEHLIDVWNLRHPNHPLAEQHVVLTVPASFDASARDLTREAALQAGLLDHMVLLEEPQAAVYAWLYRHHRQWRKMLRVGELLLVCDVGGGTTDLSLIMVDQEQGELFLRRLAVGQHLLVGGDNMDLSLAHHAAQLFSQRGLNLDPWQTLSLWHACRVAKEQLLSDTAPERYPLSLLGRGSKLIGGTVTVELERSQVAEWLVEGFFPLVDFTARPQRQIASGFQELGLPYESDTAITRHVAAFLQDHARDLPVVLQYVLFNGGVFKAEMMRQRLLDCLQRWYPQSQPQMLSGQRDLDYSVAIGAAYYGWSKQHGGVRIRGGTGRSYYIGIEMAGPAIPGFTRPLRALCVVPHGMEEGTEIDVPAEPVGLIVGQPARFRFFSSATRKDDKPGSRLTAWGADELVETDSLETILPADDVADHYVPVTFHVKLTELGQLELWCVSTRDQRRWKLEFSVRHDIQ